MGRCQANGGDEADLLSKRHPAGPRKGAVEAVTRGARHWDGRGQTDRLALCGTAADPYLASPSASTALRASRTFTPIIRAPDTSLREGLLPALCRKQEARAAEVTCTLQNRAGIQVANRLPRLSFPGVLLPLRPWCWENVLQKEKTASRCRKGLHSHFRMGATGRRGF